MSATLNHLLRDLRPFLDDPDVEEICINGPGTLWLWKHGQFTAYPTTLRAIDIENIAIVAGALRRQNVGHNQPLLATDLGGAGRLQVVLPPCVEAGKPSLTIRRGSSFSPTIAHLASGGLFTKTRGRRRDGNAADSDLVRLYHAGDWHAFFEVAVRAKKTIVLAGETASGKTTLAKALIDSIPLHERLITIEDTPEWTNLPHPNRVALYYDKNKSSNVQAGDLVEAALRMRIGRLLLQEIRDGSAATAFLQALQSGHAGGITTVHATSAEGTFDRLRVMIKQVPSGASMADADVMTQLQSLIDVVAHCQRGPDGFSISEVWFAPVALAQQVAA
ncbi:MAG: type secretion system protein VirB11 [Rhodoferax sp.]|nr:type secretion system protein VirB11 [Rhodoferax sp.]